MCKKKPANYKCHDCKEDLCKECTKYHREKDGSKSHFIQSLIDRYIQ